MDEAVVNSPWSIDPIGFRLTTFVVETLFATHIIAHNCLLIDQYTSHATLGAAQCIPL